MHPRIAELAAIGQSVWIDYLRRDVLTSGELAGLVGDGVTGLTSNPTIFEKAIGESDIYDEALDKLLAADVTDETGIQDVYEHLAVEDIQGAADALHPVYERTERRDGYVSFEVNPKLAHDTAGTIEEAQRLFRRVGRPNVMIKIPGTPEGLPAIRATLAAGMNVNVTLIFSCAVYRQVMDAYLGGLEDRLAAGGDLAALASVASFFVSRVDTAVDHRLEKQMAGGRNELAPLLGRAAVANAKIAYAAFQEVFAGSRFAKLELHGARVQRPLWASTSTKNPDYSDTLYVDELIGPHTVNTMPPVTLEALKNHGKVARTLDSDLAGARETMARLAEVGVSMDDVTEQLRQEGVAAFAMSFEKLLDRLRSRTAVA